jgi:hypothetical protein
MRLRCQAGMRWLDRPGSISTGRGDSNECDGREYRSGAAPHRAAALADPVALAGPVSLAGPVGLQTRRAASTHRTRGPSVAGTPPSRGAKPSLPQAQHS